MASLKKSLAVAATALLAAAPALADLVVGVSLPLTGPSASLGLPMQNQFKLWPSTIAGEKLVLTILDDATDPGKGVQNARRFVTEDKVDLIIGSAATPVGIAMAEVALEAQVVQIAATPAGLPPGKDAWTFRLPQSNDVMAHAMVGLMKKQGIKTVGFLGYTDAYGEQWLQAFTKEGEKNGIKIVAAERFARADTNVTAQALKLVAANPDAMLIVATGSGAAMPQKAVLERGFKGKVYQTHAAATKDFIRVAGKDAEGTFVVSGPAVIGDLLPDSNPSKKVAMDFVAKYDKAYGAGTHNQFAGHAFDALVTLEKAVPIAMKKAKPGTKEFRAAFKEAMETMGRTTFAHGVMNWTKDDHWGYTMDTGVMLQVKNGDWVLAN